MFPLTLYTKLIGAAVIALIISTLFGYTYLKGYQHGSAHVQALWDAEKAKAALEVHKDVQAGVDQGRQDVQQATDQVKQMEIRYAKLSTQYANALRQKVTCPASGEVGDVVLPASLVGSMFVHDGPASGASGPSAG